MYYLYYAFQTGGFELAIPYILDLLPIFLIAAIALVFGILNYRTNKKILKKLEEK